MEYSFDVLIYMINLRLKKTITWARIKRQTKCSQSSYHANNRHECDSITCECLTSIEWSIDACCCCCVFRFIFISFFLSHWIATHEDGNEFKQINGINFKQNFCKTLTLSTSCLLAIFPDWHIHTQSLGKHMFKWR